MGAETDLTKAALSQDQHTQNKSWVIKRVILRSGIICWQGKCKKQCGVSEVSVEEDTSCVRGLQSLKDAGVLMDSFTVPHVIKSTKDFADSFV